MKKYTLSAMMMISALFIFGQNQKKISFDARLGIWKTKGKV
jgi:hypothetical protein